MRTEECALQQWRNVNWKKGILPFLAVPEIVQLLYETARVEIIYSFYI